MGIGKTLVGIGDWTVPLEESKIHRQSPRGLDDRRWLGAVSGATALALAAVLAFAAVVAALAAALALTVVLAFTGVFGSVLAEAGVAETRLGDFDGVGLGRVLRVGSNRGSTGETGQRSGEKQSVELVFHFGPRWVWFGGGSPRLKGSRRGNLQNSAYAD